MKCRYCGTDIIFVKTAKGQKMPCEARKSDVYRNSSGKKTAMSPLGEVFKCDTEYTPWSKPESAFLVHFGNCRAYKK